MNPLRGKPHKWLELMTTDAVYNIPKELWGDGPWQTEPDRLEFKAYGFPCLMLRGPVGAWCGYVAVSSDHPFFEKSYNDINLNVHGGLTYSDHCRGSICHVPSKGELDNVWWFGFDCAHGSDVCPSFNGIKLPFPMPMSSESPFGETYKDLGWVKSEVEDLAKELSEVKI